VARETPEAFPDKSSLSESPAERPLVSRRETNSLSAGDYKKPRATELEDREYVCVNESRKKMQTDKI